MKRLCRIAFFAFSMAASMAAPGMGPANANDYPNRPVKIVLPYPGGGGIDALARPIIDRLSRIWKQPIIIENKPGASTMIGAEYVANADPDGYTLLITSDSTITSNPHLFKTSKLDPIRDLVPITQLINLHQMVVVHPSVSANTIAELVSLSKQKPNTLNYGSYGNGSQPHLLFEMLRTEAGAQIQQIPYRGIAGATTGTLANDVQMTLGAIAVSGAHVEEGRLKALAVNRKERLKRHPTVPTLEEAGFPQIDPRSWFGLFAPKGTPNDIVEKIQRDIASVLADPEFRERYIESVGNTAVASTPKEFREFITRDFEYKKRMIEVTGIKAE